MGEKEILKGELIIQNIDECAARAKRCIELATAAKDRIVGFEPQLNDATPKTEPSNSFVSQAVYRLDDLNTALTELTFILEKINQF